MSIMLILTMCFAILIPSIVRADIMNVTVDDQAMIDDWFITRDRWLATPHNNTEITDAYNPLRLVVVSHTSSTDCNSFSTCAAELRKHQSYVLQFIEIDILYNFIIGNDGRVYEGRGFNKVGEHTPYYNRCTLGLGFIGDYRGELAHSSKVTELQQARAHMLFAMGVKLGYLHPNFHVLGSKDLLSTVSPGSNLYNAIKKWPNYDHQNLYKDRTCDQIQELYKSDSNF